MAIQEIESYPYIPDKYGIPLDYLTGNSELYIEGESGRLLHIEFESNKIIIDDVNTRGTFRLHAITNNDRTLQFDLRNRRKRFIFWEEKHPDLFPQAFIEFSLRYFDHLGTKIDVIRGVWYPWSTNYQAYEKALRETRNPLVAVKATWSGRVFEVYGFSPLNSEDITVEYDRKNDCDFHRVMFRRISS